jgi:hypothetical protein
MTSGFSVGPSPGIPPTCQKDCMSFPKTLQGNGYSTAYFGKWHLTPDNMPRRGRSTAGRTRLGSTHFCWLPRRRGRSIRPPDHRYIHHRARCPATDPAAEPAPCSLTAATGRRRITQIARTGPRPAAGGELHSLHMTTAAGRRGMLAGTVPKRVDPAGIPPWCRIPDSRRGVDDDDRHPYNPQRRPL